MEHKMSKSNVKVKAENKTKTILADLTQTTSMTAPVITAKDWKLAPSFKDLEKLGLEMVGNEQQRQAAYEKLVANRQALLNPTMAKIVHEIATIQGYQQNAMPTLSTIQKVALEAFGLVTHTKVIGADGSETKRRDVLKVGSLNNQITVALQTAMVLHKATTLPDTMVKLKHGGMVRLGDIVKGADGKTDKKTIRVQGSNARSNIKEKDVVIDTGTLMAQFKASSPTITDGAGNVDENTSTTMKPVIVKGKAGVMGVDDFFYAVYPGEMPKSKVSKKTKVEAPQDIDEWLTGMIKELNKLIKENLPGGHTKRRIEKFQKVLLLLNTYLDMVEDAKDQE
jgi:hypothetical protein